MVSHFGKSQILVLAANSMHSEEDALLVLLVVSTNTQTASSHALRYVLKNRKTDEPLLVMIFTLLPKEEHGTGNDDGSVKVQDVEKETAASGNDDLD